MRLAFDLRGREGLYEALAAIKREGQGGPSFFHGLIAARRVVGAVLSLEGRGGGRVLHSLITTKVRGLGYGGHDGGEFTEAGGPHALVQVHADHHGAERVFT